MQHYSLSAEISGLEVRALPGSPAPCGPWMVRFLATTTERSVAPTRNHRNSASLQQALPLKQLLIQLLSAK